MSEKEIMVTFPGGVKVDARSGEFTVRTDQPVKAGGENSAPSPFDLFLVSIATCAGYYALAFCRERNIAVEGMSVRMTWTRDPEIKMIDRISIEIRLPAGFPEKYRAAVVKAASTCTVKAHLAKPPAFVMEARIAG
ncbi:MAG: OsmC family protein [Candidatus Aminicenantes bacterium]|jgi:ribosomal protein S12 methylthiotransferase accessory factor|nr:OsmC family protein [Candidatus Aminicenantes bacterium]